MIVGTIAHGKRVLQSLAKAKWIAKDTETQAKKRWEGDAEATLIQGRHCIRIFSICYKGVSYSFPTNKIDPKYPSIVEWADLFNWWYKNVNPNVITVFHNANYDIRVLSDQGWNPFHRIWDTMISSWMANANEDKSLKARAPFYGRYIQDTKTVDFTNLTALSNYAEGDVVVTDEIYQMHRYGVVRRPKKLVHVDALGRLVETPNTGVGVYDLVVESEKLSKFDRLFLRKQEFAVLRSTIDAETNGVPLSLDKLLEIRKPMEEDLKQVTKKIFRAAGKSFNLNASGQKAEVLTSLGCTITKKSKKTGKPSVDFESMLSMKGQHPIVDLMIDHAKISKLQSVYIGENGFEYYYNDQTGCIHPSLNTVGAVTGRFSSSNPNLQNVPARNDRYGIKKAFVAPDGELFICLDFSQIELRVMALMSQDPIMCKVLNDPKGDIHTTTHQQLQVPRDPVAKQCNFLLIFGGGAMALCQRLRLEGHNATEEECQTFIDKFDTLYFRVKQFREECFDYHRRNGYIYLLTGRKRIIENIDSSNRYLRHKAETQLSNNIIQGSAQDLAKAVIIRSDRFRPNMDKELPKLINMSREHRFILAKQGEQVAKYRDLFREAKMKWRLQVHDEVLYTSKQNYALDCAKAIADIMTFRPYWEPLWDMSVAIRGDGGVGKTWLEAKKPKDPALHVASPIKLAA